MERILPFLLVYPLSALLSWLLRYDNLQVVPAPRRILRNHVGFFAYHPYKQKKLYGAYMCGTAIGCHEREMVVSLEKKERVLVI